MMFVGHRMDEIFRVADRIAVLRDGLLVGVELASELSRDRAISLMVGRKLSALYPRREAVPGDVLLEVSGLTRPGRVRRHQLQRATRRDPRARRTGRQRPHRGRPCALRHHPADFRHDTAGSARAPFPQRRRRDGGRRRLCLRGPARPEPGDGLSHRRECRAHHPGPAPRRPASPARARWSAWSGRRSNG